MENLNWSELGFGYIKTDYNVRCYYRDGKWGELEVSSSEIINIHMAATCLHYGQESFEGLKAFRGKDGKIRVFRMDENAKRMQSSSRGIKMAELPVEMFEEAVRKVVKLNERFVPPYESGAALYIRPLMIGLGAQVGVKPAPEYMFMIFVTPVGPYFKGGFQPSKVCVPVSYTHLDVYKRQVRVDCLNRSFTSSCPMISLKYMRYFLFYRIRNEVTEKYSDIKRCGVL